MYIYEARGRYVWPLKGVRENIYKHRTITFFADLRAKAAAKMS